MSLGACVRFANKDKFIIIYLELRWKARNSYRAEFIYFLVAIFTEFIFMDRWMIHMSWPGNLHRP